MQFLPVSAANWPRILPVSAANWPRILLLCSSTEARAYRLKDGQGVQLVAGRRMIPATIVVPKELLQPADHTPPLRRHWVN